MTTTRKIVPFLLGLVLLTALFPCKAASFTDVHNDAYYYDAVEWGANNGIAKGTAPGVFSPEQPCTRAQILTFIWRAIGEPKPTNTNCPFTDVQRGSYYEQAVLWAVEFKITSGVSASKFAPDQVCTRAQAVTFLWRACGAPPTKQMRSFSDLSEGAYYILPVQWASGENITNGTSNAKFSPDQTCTCAQIITFLYRCEMNYGIIPREAPSYYDFYKEIVLRAESEYGVATTGSYHGLTTLWGVGGIRLLDLNNDGIDELLLWEDTLYKEYNVPNVGTIEVWTIVDNSPVQLYKGQPYLGGDISTTALLVSFDKDNNEWQIVIGQYGGDCNVDLYAVRDGKFVVAHYVREYDELVDGISYRVTEVDGNKKYSHMIEWYSGADEWQGLCNNFNTPQSAQNILTATMHYRAKLGL